MRVLAVSANCDRIEFVVALKGGAASHRSATKSADARRGAAVGGELRQAAGAAIAARSAVKPRAEVMIG